jgi:hypothetical protein
VIKEGNNVHVPGVCEMIFLDTTLQNEKQGKDTNTQHEKELMLCTL